MSRSAIGFAGAQATQFVPVSASSPLPVTSGATATSVGTSLGALNAAVTQAPGANGTMIVQVTGTFVGTLSLQGTIDGTNYVTFGATPQFLNLNTGAYTATITAVGVYQTSVNGLVGSKITMTAYTSGAAIVSTSITSPPAMVALDAAIPAGGNTIGGVNIIAMPVGVGLINGIASTTNATVVKASAGNVYQVDVTNLTAGPVYVKFYNKASAPTVGTDTPVLTIPVPATVAGTPPYVVEFGMAGKRFTTGVAYAITGAIGQADATAITTVAGSFIGITYG